MQNITSFPKKKTFAVQKGTFHELFKKFAQIKIFHQGNGCISFSDKLKISKDFLQNMQF